MSELPILKLLLPFGLGIILSQFLCDFQSFGFGIQLSIAIITCLALVLFFLNKSFRFRKLNFLLSFFMFLFLGGLTHQYSQPLFAQNHYTKSKIESKYLIGEVIEMQDSPSRYSKCLLEVSDVLDDSLSVVVSGKVLFFLKKGGLDVRTGHKMLVNANLEMIQNSGNPGEFDSESYWFNKGIYHMGFLRENDFSILNQGEVRKTALQKIREYSQGVLKEIVPEKYYGVANALIIGDKGDLDRSVKNEFSDAGAVHVLAVSGLHVGILLLMLNQFFKFFKVFKKFHLNLILPVVVLWVYAGLTGFSPSVLRAVIMFSILTFGLLKGRQLFSLNVLFTSAFILLVFNPNYLFDIGFQLSYVAMIGIGIAFRPISNVFYFKSKLIRWLWLGLSVSLAAQLFTFPLTLFYFHQFPNYFVLTNLGMMVFAGLTLGSGLIYLMVAKVPLLKVVSAKVLVLSLTGMIVFVSWVSELPFAVATGFQLYVWEIFILFIGLFFLFNGRANLNVWRFRIGFILIVIPFCLIQVRRYESMVYSENRVLNLSFPVLMSKNGLETIAYYSPSNASDEKEFSFVKQAYEKYYGTNVRPVNVANGKVYFNESVDLVVESSPSFLQVANRRQSVQVRTSEDYNLIVNLIKNGTFTSLEYRNKSMVIDDLFLQ